MSYQPKNVTLLDNVCRTLYNVRMKDKLVAFRLETKAHEALEKIGKDLDRSVSWLIRKAVEEYLARQKETKGKRK